MSKGWLCFHRKIFEHQWLTKTPAHFMAWTAILAETDYKTGSVNLSKVKEMLEPHLTRSAWRNFIDKLINDNMISGVETVNLGSTKGHRQTATVVNWHIYNCVDAVEPQPTESPKVAVVVQLPAPTVPVTPLQAPVLEPLQTLPEQVLSVADIDEDEDNQEVIDNTPLLQSALAYSSEEKTLLQMQGKANPTWQAIEAKRCFQRLLGSEFSFSQVQLNYARWYSDYGEDFAKAAWDESKQLAVTKGKKRLYVFVDLFSNYSESKVLSDIVRAKNANHRRKLPSFSIGQTVLDVQTGHRYEVTDQSGALVSAMTADGRYVTLPVQRCELVAP